MQTLREEMERLKQQKEKFPSLDEKVKALITEGDNMETTNLALSHYGGKKQHHDHKDDRDPKKVPFSKEQALQNLLEVASIAFDFLFSFVDGIIAILMSQCCSINMASNMAITVWK